MKISNPLALLEKFQSRWDVQLEDLIIFQTQVKIRLLECHREWERAVAERAAQSETEDKESYKKSDVAHLNRECLAFNRQYITLARDIEKLEAEIAEVETIQAEMIACHELEQKHLIDQEAEENQHAAMTQPSTQTVTAPDRSQDSPLFDLPVNPSTASTNAIEPVLSQLKGDLSLYPSDPTKRSVATLAYEMLGFKDRILNSDPVIELQSTAS